MNKCRVCGSDTALGICLEDPTHAGSVRVVPLASLLEEQGDGGSGSMNSGYERDKLDYERGFKDGVCESEIDEDDQDNESYTLGYESGQNLLKVVRDNSRDLSSHFSVMKFYTRPKR
jgi:hypothetical protein